MTEEAKAKRSRNFVVLRIYTEPGPELTFEAAKMDLPDMQAARKWIKDHGENGRTYQIASFRGGYIKVHVESVEKRTLEES